MVWVVVLRWWWVSQWWWVSSGWFWFVVGLLVVVVASDVWLVCCEYLGFLVFKGFVAGGGFRYGVESQ